MPLNLAFTPFVGQIYECTLQKLRSQEDDQIISNLGDVLNAKLVVCLPIFLELLDSKMIRLSAVKALIMIASSPLHVNFSTILVSKTNISKFASLIMD